MELEKVKYFAFYESFNEILNFLDECEQLRFLKAIINYGLYGVEPDFTGKDAAIFSQIKFAINKKETALNEHKV